MNTEFRKKASSKFKKNFYKLMNNYVFGKTMENVRKDINVKLVCSRETEKIRKLVANPLYSWDVIFTNDLVGVNMYKKQAAAGQTCLRRGDDS